MTTLEIKRIDSVKTRSTSGLNSNNSSGVESSLVKGSSQQQQQNGGVASRQPQSPTSQSVSSPSVTKSSLKTTTSTSNNNNNNSNPNDQQLPDVVPIPINRSSSYNDQFGMTLAAQDKEEPEQQQKQQRQQQHLNNSSSHSPSQSPPHMLDQSGGTGTELIDTDALKFNRYGFAQTSKVNEHILNAEASKNGGMTANGTTKEASGEDADESRSSSSRTGGQVVVTNLKDYLQNSDVEEFAENLPIKVIQQRELKWVEMLAHFDEWMLKRFKKIKSRCRKGIPQSMRSKAWMHLTGAVLLKNEKPNYYAECLANPKQVEIGKYVEDIKKDLHRQFPSHEIFMKREGRQMLQNVLMAYAVHNREVGYCQAQGPIAALLLMHMPEEDAFWLLIRISDFYLTEYYKPGLEKVQIDGRALFHLFKKEKPAAAKLMQQQSIDPILYMTEWFMCVYARTLPWCTVLRVWDMFFCEGVKVLYRVGLYLMNAAFSHDKQKYARAQQQGMYETLNLLKNLPVEALKESVLVHESCLIRVSDSELKKTFEKAKVEFVRQTAEMQAQRKQPPAKSSYMNTKSSGGGSTKEKKK